MEDLHKIHAVQKSSRICSVYGNLLEDLWLPFCEEDLHVFFLEDV